MNMDRGRGDRGKKGALERIIIIIIIIIKYLLPLFR